MSDDFSGDNVEFHRGEAAEIKNSLTAKQRTLTPKAWAAIVRANPGIPFDEPYVDTPSRRWRVVNSEEFQHELYAHLKRIGAGRFKSVTGPGRSGAVAAVFASHWLGIPYVPPQGQFPPALRPVLIIDTAEWTGATLRKAQRKLTERGIESERHAVFNEKANGLVKFWYEDAVVRRRNLDLQPSGGIDIV